jgi:hypothetical protein
MQEDLKLIRQKIRAANKLPESNPKEYNLKQDILRHWKGEQYKLMMAIEMDIRTRNFLAPPQVWARLS